MPSRIPRSSLAVNRIVVHGLNRGFWSHGDLIGDPFAGVCLGGIVAAYHGLRWVGVEVEPRYQAIALANFHLHRLRWEALAVAQPQCLLGDSRRLDEIVAEGLRRVAGHDHEPPVRVGAIAAERRLLDFFSKHPKPVRL